MIDVGAAGVLADLDQALRPRLAAVGGLIQAALAAALPQRPRRRDVDHVGIARVHHDARDVLGSLQPHVAPGPAAVFALVDAVAVGDAALIVVLAGAHPDDRRILGIDRDVADRIRAVVVEYRRPGGAVVVGQPDAARGFGDQVMIGIVGEHRDLRDAAGDECRADVARAQAGERRGVDRLVGARRRDGRPAAVPPAPERQQRDTKESGNSLMDGEYNA